MGDVFPELTLKKEPYLPCESLAWARRPPTFIKDQEAGHIQGEDIVSYRREASAAAHRAHVAAMQEASSMESGFGGKRKLWEQ